MLFVQHLPPDCQGGLIDLDNSSAMWADIEFSISVPNSRNFTLPIVSGGVEQRFSGHQPGQVIESNALRFPIDMDSEMCGVPYRFREESLTRIYEVTMNPKTMVCLRSQRTFLISSEVRIGVQHSRRTLLVAVGPNLTHERSIEIGLGSSE
jgi:hypothetical protein